MSCVTLETILKSCDNNSGGIYRFLVNRQDQIDEANITLDAAPNDWTIDALPLIGGGDAFIDLEFRRNVSSYTEDSAIDLINGSTYVTSTINLMFHRRDQDKSKAIAESKPNNGLVSDVTTLVPIVKKTSQELIANKKLIALIRSAIEIASDETGWAQLGGVGSSIEKQATDFDPRTYGYKKLSDLVSAIELFEVVKDNMRVLITEKTKK